jgi:hypothetical protein
LYHFRVRASCFFSLLPELYLLDSTSLHFVYASVDPDGTPGYLPYFSLERPFSPILTRDHREESSKRSPTVALRYEEPRAAYQATLCLSEAGT